MPDFLTKLIDDAQKRVRGGYYNVREETKRQPLSLKHAIKSAKKNAIIAEIKPISPARGPLRPMIDPVEAAHRLEKGGAIALSVLTEPDNFGGSLENLRRVGAAVRIPVLMKDVMIDPVQIEAGRKTGADCILLIESAFSNHRVASLEAMIDDAHKCQLEVLLEVHNEEELGRALKSQADIVGINNRNLATLEIDLQTTTRLVGKITQRAGKLVVSESGLESAEDIRKLKSATVDGFLIGSSIMLSQDWESKVREFVVA